MAPAVRAISFQRSAKGGMRCAFPPYELIEQHTENTQSQVEVVVADSQYGTTKNYLECHDRGLKAHISPFKDGQSRNGKFSDEAFSYDPKDDVYLCPAGQRLKRTRYDRNRETFQYQGKAKICKACALKDKCTGAKTGRTINRHLRQEEVRLMRDRAQSFRSKQDLRTRQHLMERSFARAVPYGFKRARWRRLWRVRIQEYLTAAIQNIMILVKDVKEPGRAISLAIKKTRDKWLNLPATCLALITRKGPFPWAGCCYIVVPR